jgi:hypothetical protein
MEMTLHSRASNVPERIRIRARTTIERSGKVIRMFALGFLRTFERAIRAFEET